MYTEKGGPFNNIYHSEGPFALYDKVLRNNITGIMYLPITVCACVQIPHITHTLFTY